MAKLHPAAKQNESEQLGLSQSKTNEDEDIGLSCETTRHDAKAEKK